MVLWEDIFNFQFLLLDEYLLEFSRDSMNYDKETLRQTYIYESGCLLLAKIPVSDKNF